MKFVPLLFTSFLVEIPHAQPTNGLIINQLKHAFSYAFLLPHWLQTPNTTFINSFSLFLSLHNRRQDKQGKNCTSSCPIERHKWNIAKWWITQVLRFTLRNVLISRCASVTIILHCIRFLSCITYHASPRISPRCQICKWHYTAIRPYVCLYPMSLWQNSAFGYHRALIADAMLDSVVLWPSEVTETALAFKKLRRQYIRKKTVRAPWLLLNTYRKS